MALYASDPCGRRTPLATTARVRAEDELPVVLLLDGGRCLAVRMAVAGPRRAAVVVALPRPARALKELVLSSWFTRQRRAMKNAARACNQQDE